MQAIKVLQENASNLKRILSRTNFYQELCSYSNNDIRLTISNLSKIISYYIYSNDKNTSYSLKDLFTKISDFSIKENKYLIYPTSSYYYNAYRLTGLNNKISLTTKVDDSLITLANLLSVFPNLEEKGIRIYDDLESTIPMSFSSPYLLYHEILKQPSSKEQPIILGTEEKTYYSSILKRRLEETTLENFCTGTVLASKTITKLLGETPLLVLFPIELVTSEEVKFHETISYIPSSSLSFIKIPSYYELISICAQNKGLTPSTAIDYNTGDEYQKDNSSEYKSSPYTYSRYEYVCVDDNFDYTSNGLTGDALYDIDKIYGVLDSNKSREMLTNMLEDNISRIKRSTDINVQKNSNLYHIENGRHRIIFLKRYYLDNYEYYKRTNRLERLKDKVTIPMLVEHSIEEPNYLKYLNKIKRITKINILKNDPRNDKLELFIVLQDLGISYYIRTIDELIDLYNNIEANNYYNKYFVCKCNTNKLYSYDDLFRALILIFEYKLETMGFIDIINYLKKNVELQKTYDIDFSNLNINILYMTYNNYLNSLASNKFFNTKKDPVKTAKEEIEYETIGKSIINFIKNNQEYLDLPWSELYIALHEIPEFSPYSSEFLRACADYKGYQKIMLKAYYDENNKRKK